MESVLRLDFMMDNYFQYIFAILTITSTIIIPFLIFAGLRCFVTKYN